MSAVPESLVRQTRSSDSLQALFDAQRQAFAAHPFPSLRERRAALKRLQRAVARRAEEYIDAVQADFGTRHADETLLSELFTFAESARYAVRHLRSWMKPERRMAGLLMAGNRCDVERQPLGVVGIMAPWNYPFLMVMRPLVCALAAGNRVLVKPSEITPRSAEFMARLFQEVFPAGEVVAVTGDAQVAQAFSALPFDHLLFTGSTEIGRHVMRAAADNLTPVTLELGGKSPTLVAPDADVAAAAERIAFGKCVNAGQTCVAPDYVLVPREKEDALCRALHEAVAAMYPEGPASEHYTSLVNERGFERIRALLDDARGQGARADEIGGRADAVGRKHPLTVLRDVNDDMRVMREEIFGPLLPVVPYDSVDEALAYINARPRPLCLNLFTTDAALRRRVVRETHSGAVATNDAITYVAVDDLPFGGVGESGMGKYMGREGFLTFSHSKTVFRRAAIFNSAKLLYAPYGGRAFRLLRKFLLR